MKFDVERFNGKNRFVFWQEKVKNIFVNQSLKSIVHEGKNPDDMSDKY